MKNLLFVFLVALLVTFTVYWKIPVKGFVPFPGDLLVGRFFPFNTESREGYPTGVPYKEFINSDVVRQIYPWRDLSIQSLKNGRIPWWNPYSFSGTPLLANIQSAPFYPINFLYWLTSHQNAWIIGVLLQSVLAMVFMWLFTREQGLSKPASALSALAFAFSGYMVVWFELNTIGHAALWLPLALWAIERWIKKRERKDLFLLTFALTSSLLAGHLQTSIYVLIVSLAFALFRLKDRRTLNFRKSFPIATTFALSFFLALVQLLPAIKLLPFTPRGIQSDSQIFDHFILPLKHLITFLVHDFFGNPAASNFWGVDYGEFIGFFGLVAFIFSVIAIFSVRTKEVKFFIIMALAALLFALPTHLPQLLRVLNIPILSTSAPSRTLFIVQFAGTVLAGYGFDYWIKKKKLSVIKPILLIGTVLLISWVVAVIKFKTSDTVMSANWKVTLRNLVIPTTVFLGVSSMIIGVRIPRIQKLFPHVKRIGLVIIFLLAIGEYSYFANKFQTFSEKRFFFPKSVIYSFLTEQSRNYPHRIFGDYTASVTSNSWVPYRIYGVEGYDSLYLKRFGELLAASQTGEIPTTVPRSDANLVKNSDDFRRRRLQDLMGVKFILDKNDNPTSDWEPDPHRFPPERYQLLWQDGKFKVYENTQSLPRAFLVGNVTVEKDPQKIIDLLFSQEIDLSNAVILEEELPIDIESSNSDVEFIKYDANEIQLRVNSPTRQLLFLSDSYYPDWQATVDGVKTKIYRANYSFRAIVIPPGSHQVEFKYHFKIF